MQATSSNFFVQKDGPGDKKHQNRVEANFLLHRHCREEVASYFEVEFSLG